MMMTLRHTRRPRALLLAGMLCALVTLTTACSGAPKTPDDDVTQRTVDQRLLDARTVHRRLLRHDDAPRHERELEQASVWISRVEILMSDADHDPAQLDLLLDTIEGQLIMIRTSYDARTARQALEDTRARYERRAKTIEQARKAQDDAIRRTRSAQDTP